MENTVKILTKIEEYFIYLTVFLSPLFFLPLFVNRFDTSKILLLFLLTIILFVIKIVKNIIGKEFSFSSSKADIGIIAIAVSYLLAGIFATPNKYDAFFVPGGATLLILGAIFFFIINQLPKKAKENTLYSILASSFVASIVYIFTFTKIINIGITTPLGMILTHSLFMLLTLVVSVYLIFNEKSVVAKSINIVFSLVIFISLFLSVYALLPGKDTSLVIPSYKISWFVAVDTIKNSPLFGAGPSNYLESYSRFRPIIANSYDSWATLFTTGASAVFTIASEAGLVGLVAFVLLFILLLRNSESGLLKIVSLVFILALFLIPVPAFVFFIFFAIIASTIKSSPSQNINTSGFKVPFIALIIPFLAGFVYLTIFSVKAFSAENYYYRAYIKTASGDGSAAYNFINLAIAKNPYIGRYHILSSDLSMAFAKNIATKDNVTDEDKTLISQLVQQSIKESRATVSVNPRSSLNWQHLSGVYQQIIPFANGADGFAIQTLNQAISLDPINPKLRVSLGGLYYSLNKYPEAIDAFKLAIIAKPDFANAHYNLSSAYKANGDIEKAMSEMEIVISLVEQGSKDWEIASKELDTLRNTPAKEANPLDGETLVAPEEILPTNIEPKINI